MHTFYKLNLFLIQGQVVYKINLYRNNYLGYSIDDFDLEKLSRDKG